MTLEKDPQQEDFLQGRMLGNPYSSNEPGLGPLMRDVKNKICQGAAPSCFSVSAQNLIMFGRQVVEACVARSFAVISSMDVPHEYA